MVKRIVGIILLVFGMLMGMSTAASLDNADPAPEFMIAAAFILLGVFLIWRSTKAQREKNKQKKFDATAQKVQKSRTIQGMHISGLPLAQGAPCSITFDEQEIAIVGGGNEFNLSVKKITDAMVKTETEIQKLAAEQTQYVSSLGGAIAGGLVFGPLGAMIGGRAKKKNVQQRGEVKKEDHFLIVTYDKDDEIASVTFELDAALKKAQALAKKCMQSVSNKPAKKIEL